MQDDTIHPERQVQPALHPIARRHADHLQARVHQRGMEPMRSEVRRDGRGRGDVAARVVGCSPERHHAAERGTEVEAARLEARIVARRIGRLGGRVHRGRGGHVGPVTCF